MIKHVMISIWASYGASNKNIFCECRASGLTDLEHSPSLHSTSAILEVGDEVGLLEAIEQSRKTMGRPYENGGFMGFYGIYHLVMST